MRVWKISPWFDANDWTVFVNQNCMYVGDFNAANRLGDLRKKYSCRDDLRKQGVSGSGVAQLWNFYNEMKESDAVVAYSENQIWGIGKITSDYDFRTVHDYRDGRDYEWHVRKAKWVELRPPLNVKSDEFLFGSPPNKYGALNKQLTVVELGDDVWDHILKYPEAKKAYEQLV